MIFFKTKIKTKNKGFLAEDTSKKGFTIIETIVAMVIIVLMITALSRVAQQHILLLDRLQEKTQSNQLVWNEIVGLLYEKKSVQSLSYNMDFVSKKWFVEREVEQTIIPGFYKITINAGMEKENPSSIATSFMFFGSKK